MNQDIMPLVTYALTSAVGVIGILIAVIWNNMRSEAKGTALALDKKASGEALKEVKQSFHEALARNDREHQEQIRVLRDKQDREIDWLKDEMNKINSSLVEMRKENTQAMTTLMQRLDLILSHERRQPTL